MGALPGPRVNPSRPFSHTGIDYAGPIQIRMSKGRGNRSTKGYIAIFVCLTTKAMHLEAVTDLTTEGFLAAFRRFVARRGLCSHVYSDNGTNFVGANRQLSSDLTKSIKKQQPDIAESLANQHIQWHFIPPASPHFGGLWEAGVKSTKYHLKRVIGETTLTYEEMSTLLAMIEACLNSRPICPLDEDEFDALTPGHFLVGAPLVDVPTEDLVDRKIPNLTRWQLVKQMQQHFWNRWSSEYLTHLSHRTKWNEVQNNIKLGEVILLKEDPLPPGKWQMGRIEEIHPGKDGLTRVVTVRTKDRLLKRPVTKLCRLPTNDDSNSIKTTKNPTTTKAVYCVSLLFIGLLCTLPTTTAMSNLDPAVATQHWTFIYAKNIQAYNEDLRQSRNDTKEMDRLCVLTKRESLRGSPCDEMVAYYDNIIEQIIRADTQMGSYLGRLPLSTWTNVHESVQEFLENGTTRAGYTIITKLDGNMEERMRIIFDQNAKLLTKESSAVKFMKLARSVAVKTADIETTQKLLLDSLKISQQTNEQIWDLLKIYFKAALENLKSRRPSGIELNQSHGTTITIGNTSELMVLVIKVPIERRNNSNRDQMSHHEVHHYIIAYTTLGILIIFIVIYIRNRNSSSAQQFMLPMEYRSTPQQGEAGVCSGA